MMEDLPGLAPGPAPSPAPSPTVAPDPAPDAYRPVGLTKAVLSLHTQKEEQAFLSRFRDLGRLRGLDTSSVAPSAPGERGSHLGFLELLSVQPAAGGGKVMVRGNVSALGPRRCCLHWQDHV